MLLSLTAGLDFSAYAAVSSGTCGDNVTYTFDSSTGELVISGSGDMDDYNANADSPLYTYRLMTKTITIEDGVTGIGEHAFSANRFTGISIPNSVTYIGKYAFLGCSSITNIAIPNGVKTISEHLFSRCSSLERVSLPNSVKIISDWSFNECSSLKNIIIPNSVTSIGGFVFYNCTGLESITIPERVTSIGSHIFSGCTSLSSISVSENNTTLDSRNSCNAIIETKTNALLCGCKNTIIPDSVTSLNPFAFSNCKGLKRITIPKNVTSIGNYSFSDCSALKKITIPRSVTNISNNAFDGCSHLNDVYYEGSEAEWNRISIGLNNSPLTDTANIWFNHSEHDYVAVVTPPTETEAGYTTYTCSECEDSYKVMENEIHNHEFGEWTVSTPAFAPTCTTEGATAVETRSCSACGETETRGGESVAAFGHNYQAVYISPDDITRIKYICSRCGDSYTTGDPEPPVVITGKCGYNVNYEFDGATGTLTISGTGEMDDYTAEEIDEDDITCTSPFFRNSDIRTIVIEDGVTSIGDFAFLECTNLTEVTMADSVTSIGEASLSHCFALTELTIGNGVTTIGIHAFNSNREMTHVTIPSSVTFIDKAAFSIMPKLGNVYYLGSESSWNNITIDIGNDCLTDASIHFNCVPPHEHNYVADVTTPTCTEAGFTVYTCSICGDNYYSDFIDALGHSFTDWTVSRYPTCTTKGLSVRYCNTCGLRESKVLDKVDHTPESVERTEPTCISVGYTEGEICETCGIVLSGREVLPKINHNYVVDSAHSRPATCTETGINYYKCSMCGESYTSTLSLLPHTYEITEKVDSMPNEHGYEIFTCSECGTFYKEYLPYASDNSALIAALLKASLFGKGDFSAESYDAFQQIYEACDVISNIDSSQAEIDNAIAQIITAINSLVPYASINIEAENGSVSVAYDGNTYTDSSYSILYGTRVTLTATADEGYEFAGWYENTTKRVFSTDEVYSFFATSNMTFCPIFNETASATLSFENESGWVAGTVCRKASEWRAVTTIEDLLPEVPYKLGYENGRWEYDEADVLAQLGSGNDVVITAVYDKSEELPTLPDEPEDANVPTLKMAYCYDPMWDVGSFVMRAKVPEGCTVYSIGIAFAHGNRKKFNPNSVFLTLSNKSDVSQFYETDPNGIYIVDVCDLSWHNWAAVGYITYFDENNELKIVYSNQINVVNTVWVR